MDIEDFRASVAELATLLKAIARVAPKRVDQGLVDYLDRLADDPCGLEILRNSIQPEHKIAAVRSA